MVFGKIHNLNLLKLDRYVCCILSWHVNGCLLGICQKFPIWTCLMSICGDKIHWDFGSIWRKLVTLTSLHVPLIAPCLTSTDDIRIILSPFFMVKREEEKSQYGVPAQYRKKQNTNLKTISIACWKQQGWFFLLDPKWLQAHQSLI